MPIRAVAFDLDDTLLRDDRTISDDTVKTLLRAAERGILVIPASGRARESMRGFVDQLGCAVAYIACNGAELYSAEHRLIASETLPVSVALEIVDFCARWGIYLQTYAGDCFYYNQRGAYAEGYARQSLLRGEYVGDLARFIRQPVTKILGMAEEETIARIIAEAQPYFAGRAQVTGSKPWFIEFNPPSATKGNGLRHLGALLGFDLRETVAFGDSLNDLSMLEAAGIGVAMANARPDVLARVRTHTVSNQEDGVARWIEQHLLEET